MSEMNKVLRSSCVILILLLPVLGQSIEPVLAPSDVTLHFSTEGDQHQFHLGELIPIKYSYRSETPGKYFLVGLSNKLAGGRPVEVSCSPSVERVSRLPLVPGGMTLDAMLNSCGGVAFGSGGSCMDCDSETPLGPTELGFGMPLNTYIRFRMPGTYTCTASTADVTMVSRDEKVRPALLMKSNPVVLIIADDPRWSRAADSAYADVYGKVCRADNVTTQISAQCGDVARRITYLDTADSLATEVRFFDGRNHDWENGFWDAIQQSSYPNEALSLMANRIQDPDFEVSTMVVESLADWDLRADLPEAFQSSEPQTYHSAAVEKLRKYVRLLGSSLKSKSANVRSESVKTYRSFAEQEYCEGRQLISREERNQAITPQSIRP
jgi:hypothetical protein